MVRREDIRFFEKDRRTFGFSGRAFLPFIGSFICFFLSDYVTSHYPMYLYDIEADEYDTYTGIQDIPNVVFCILRQNGHKVEVSRQYYDTEYSMPYGFGVKATVELPTSTEKRRKTP